VARITYGVLALAFATLVSGFFFRHSSLPLLISIGLSGVVFVLILAGWSRRLRQAGAPGLAPNGDEEEDLGGGIVVVDLDATGEITKVAPPAARAASRTAKGGAAKTAVIERKPARKAAPRKAVTPKVSAKKTTRKAPVREVREEHLEFMPVSTDDETATAVVPPPPPAKRKPANAKGSSKSKTPARKSKPKSKPAERRVVVIPGRDRYHVAGCRFARAPGAQRIAESTAKRRGYTACSVCLA
jgi:hypothetical protein